VQRTGDELKLVYPQAGFDPSEFVSFEFKHFFLSPMDGPSRVENTELAVAYCMEHPQWRMSLQTHKILSIR
jgi:7-carboxy-7-deazaguanine synthase